MHLAAWVHVINVLYFVFRHITCMIHALACLITQSGNITMSPCLVQQRFVLLSSPKHQQHALLVSAHASALLLMVHCCAGAGVSVWHDATADAGSAYVCCTDAAATAGRWQATSCIWSTASASSSWCSMDAAAAIIHTCLPTDTAEPVQWCCRTFWLSMNILVVL